MLAYETHSMNLLEAKTQIIDYAHCHFEAHNANFTKEKKLLIKCGSRTCNVWNCGTILYHSSHQHNILGYLKIALE